MTILNNIRRSIATLFGYHSSDDGPTGAEAVRQAVKEIEDILNSTVDARLGEPDIVQGEGRYFNDAQVVVPVYDLPLVDDTNLMFDLPEGVDDELSQFNQLLDMFGVEFENMEDLEGTTVPVEFHGGNPVVAWDKVVDPEENDSGVTVEETTISADTEGDDV